MNMVSPIRNKKQLDLLKMYLRSKSKRDYLMFMVGISSALRISDILKLKVKDIWDGKMCKEFIYLHEEKTGKYKRFPITENLEKAIIDYMEEYNPKQESYLFFSRIGNKPITRQQAANILSSAADFVGIKEPVSTHSMRKTWGYWAYKRGYSLALIMEALNHSSIAMTKKYLGITQEDLDDVYRGMNL